MENSKTVKEACVETVHLVHPGNLNAAGRIYGGTLMSWIDDVAVLVAKRHTGMSVTTASVDNLKFLRAARLKDIVVISGKATYVGNTSMEVKVETFVEHLDGSRELVNRAFLTLVGLDEAGRPSPIPKLTLISDEDKEEWGRAQKRREIRMKQAKEGFHFY